MKAIKQCVCCHQAEQLWKELRRCSRNFAASLGDDAPLAFLSLDSAEAVRATRPKAATKPPSNTAAASAPPPQAPLPACARTPAPAAPQTPPGDAVAASVPPVVGGRPTRGQRCGVGACGKPARCFARAAPELAGGVPCRADYTRKDCASGLQRHSTRKNEHTLKPSPKGGFKPPLWVWFKPILF